MIVCYLCVCVCFAGTILGTCEDIAMVICLDVLQRLPRVPDFLPLNSLENCRFIDLCSILSYFFPGCPVTLAVRP